MCGIAGVFNSKGELFSQSHLQKMADSIAHRGPDAEGYFIENGIALAHRRLSILDISARYFNSSIDIMILSSFHRYIIC